MALELGVKVSRGIDNATSVSELRISKNTAGPVFVSTETHSTFILTCYLKGYDRNSFRIKISEDGKEISISGEKSVQEMLMMGRVMKKNVQIVGFKKVFEIPNGVFLDGIIAKFDEDESFLKIVMPKLVKGICGVQIEEVKNRDFGESSKENESVCKEIEHGENEAPNKSITEDRGQQRVKDITKETQKEKIAENKYECEGKDGESVGAKVNKEGLEAVDTGTERREPEKLIASAFGINGENIIQERPKTEVETKFEREGKDKERVGTEVSEGGLGAIDSTIEGRKSKELLAGAFAFGTSGEAILERTQKKENKETTFGSKGKDEEKVRKEINKGGIEAVDTTMEKRESEKDLVGANEGDEKGKVENKRREVEKVGLKTEGRDEERERRVTTEEELEAIETGMDGVELKKVNDENIEVGKESLEKGIKEKKTESEDKERRKDIVGGGLKTDFDKHKPENGERDKGRVRIEASKDGNEAIDTTRHRGSEAAMFEMKGKEEKKVGTENNKKGPGAIERKIEVRESKKVLVGKIGVREEDIVEGTEQRETDGTKFETEDKDKEKMEERFKGTQEKVIGKNEFAVEGKYEERVGTKIKEELGAKDATIIGRISGSRDEEMLKEEISNEEFEARKTKIKESPMQNPKLQIQLEESEGAFEGIEEPKMFEEARKANGNDFTSDSGKREIEQSAVRSSRDGQHVQENIVSKVFEDLGTDTAKLPKQTSETKAQRVKEMKMKEEVAVNKYDEAKEGFEKATNGDRIQLETGLPSEGRGFDEETSKTAKWDHNKAVEEEGSVENETFLKKGEGDSNDNVQGAIFSPNMKDDKWEEMERTQKVTEDPKIGTKQKAQHCVQELPMNKAKSMDERKGPNDTKAEEMKEAKRKNEGTQVVADQESKIEAFENGMREREIMMSTRQSEVKEIDKECEECKGLGANHEREKWRTTQGVNDEKPRRENADKQVAESMQNSPEKKYTGRAEVEKEVKSLEAELAYPEHRKEVDTKNNVEGLRSKELPRPKVKVKSLMPLESEKKNMKWKSPKTKKLVPEARGEEYEGGKPPEVKSSSSTQHFMVDEEKSEMDFPKSDTSRTPSVEKDMKALQPKVLADQNLEGKKCFKTLTEDRGHYLLEKETRLETKKDAEEENLNKKDEEGRTKIAESKDEKSRMKRNGSEGIDQIKGVAEEFRDVLEDNEKEKSQEILLPQAADIQGRENISEIREVQQEKRRQIPFHANRGSEEIKFNREVESQKPDAAHLKGQSIKFSCDKPKGEVDKLQRKNSLSPSAEELSKVPSKTARPCIKEDCPTVENFPQFHEGKESTSLEGTKASETEEGKIDKCCDDTHSEFQEPKKLESELDFQETNRRRLDQEVEKSNFSQQEDVHEGHAIGEARAGEAENVTQVEITQESEDLEDIEVEASAKKVELCSPLVFAGSVFIASLIIFFFGHKRAGKR